MIAVIGSINMDLVVMADRAPDAGETVLGNNFYQVFGGKGANQAVAAARCGAETTMVGRVGNDSFGETILKGLKREFAEGAAIERIDGIPTGIAVIPVSYTHLDVYKRQQSLRCSASSVSRFGYPYPSIAVR